MSNQSSPPEPPPARRVRPPSWRDPRLIVGVVVIAGSVLLGSRVLAGADDTIAVWVASADLSAGERLTTQRLVSRRVDLSEDTLAARYLPSSAGLPEDARLSRDVADGELVPRAALHAEKHAPLVEVPLAAPVGAVPATVRRGSVVDVWVTPRAAGGSGRDNRAVRVFDDVVVVALPPRESTLAPSGNRQVIVGVASDQARRLGAALGGAATGRVVLTRQE